MLSNDSQPSWCKRTKCSIRSINFKLTPQPITCSPRFSAACLLFQSWFIERRCPQHVLLKHMMKHLPCRFARRERHLQERAGRRAHQHQQPSHAPQEPHFWRLCCRLASQTLLDHKIIIWSPFGLQLTCHSLNQVLKLLTTQRQHWRATRSSTTALGGFFWPQELMSPWKVRGCLYSLQLGMLWLCYIAKSTNFIKYFKIF